MVVAEGNHSPKNPTDLNVFEAFGSQVRQHALPTNHRPTLRESGAWKRSGRRIVLHPDLGQHLVENGRSVDDVRKVGARRPGSD